MTFRRSSRLELTRNTLCSITNGVLSYLVHVKHLFELRDGQKIVVNEGVSFMGTIKPVKKTNSKTMMKTMIILLRFWFCDDDELRRSRVGDHSTEWL